MKVPSTSNTQIRIVYLSLILEFCLSGSYYERQNIQKVENMAKNGCQKIKAKFSTQSPNGLEVRILFRLLKNREQGTYSRTQITQLLSKWQNMTLKMGAGEPERARRKKRSTCTHFLAIFHA